MLQDAQDNGEQNFAQFRSEVNDLRKFVVLNYIAVIKAFKKRNRHLQVTTHAQLAPNSSTSNPLHDVLCIVAESVHLQPCLECPTPFCTHAK